MKAFVTSIGEKTTILCCQQLRRFGFEVVLLDDKESWFDKYRKFINMADEDCIRVDADVIVNENIKQAEYNSYNYLMIQYLVFDFYQNNIGNTTPVFYSKKVFPIIRSNLHRLNPLRPETSAWRLPEINPKTVTSEIIMGMHGFAQDDKTIAQAKENKIARRQIKNYDFELAIKLNELCQK